MEREKHFVVGGNTHPGITNTRTWRRESKIKYKDFTFFHNKVVRERERAKQNINSNLH